jgi:capsule polysaccharide export protein KpsE/RkpR
MLINRQSQQQRRFRGRSLDTQLAEAVREFTAADPETRIMLKVRITALQKMVARKERRDRQKRGDKLEAALLEIERLTAEVSVLQAELTAALTAKPVASKPTAARPLTDAERALAQYESEKNGGAQ